MDLSTNEVAPPPAALVTSVVTVTVPTAKPWSFHELLSELNPLQYLPVVGTIYRSVTGDTIPEDVRTIGALAVSGAIGGPIGIATSLAALVIEKATGIDPEKIGQTLLAQLGIGIGAGDAPAIAATVPQAAPAATAVAAASVGAAPGAWSAAQLAAYGVTRSNTGALTLGDLAGSDVLNDLELRRHMSPAAA
jgi:hypothetical protein